MKIDYAYIFKSKIGFIKLVANDKFLKVIEYLDDDNITSDLKENQSNKNNNLIIKEAEKQLQEYFNKRRKNFTVPIEIIGSDFAKKVLNELIKIPFGETVSYKDIAIRINNENASRAVGRVNHYNKIPIIIPCHRVIGGKKTLIGYNGGKSIIKKLYEIENITLNNDKMA